jgi:hypothetical protein
MITRKTIKGLIAAVAMLMLAPASWASLANYSQDFEGLNAADGSALGNAGFLYFANVYGPGGAPYLYGYGPGPAPNNTPGFSSVAIGQGGVPQGNQQLVVYSDYNNVDHAIGNRVEANVFQERILDAGDIGKTAVFTFDAKHGDLGGASTSLAFIKTLDPNNSYATTNFITLDMTSIPVNWGTYMLSLALTPALNGQILQFGFSATASYYESSGTFYDNLNFAAVPVPGAVWLFGSALGLLGVARRRLLA